jgi:hypothetical protein
MNKKSSQEALSQTIYDRQNVFQRIKEIVSLPLFILIAAIFSIVIMSAITIPILTFVLEDEVLFTKSVEIGLLILFILFILSRIISGIIFYIKTGLSPLVIAKTVVLNRLTSFFLLLFSLLVIIALAASLIYLFSYHSKFIDFIFN